MLSIPDLKTATADIVGSPRGLEEVAVVDALNRSGVPINSLDRSGLSDSQYVNLGTLDTRGACLSFSRQSAAIGDIAIYKGGCAVWNGESWCSDHVHDEYICDSEAGPVTIYRYGGRKTSRPADGVGQTVSPGPAVALTCPVGVRFKNLWARYYLRTPNGLHKISHI